MTGHTAARHLIDSVVRRLSRIAVGVLLLVATPVIAGPNQWTVIFPNAGTLVSLVIDPSDSDRLYLLRTLPPDLWRSDNRGFTWKSLRSGTKLTDAGSVRQIAIDPGNPNHLLVISSLPSSFYQSFDAGETWSGGPFDTNVLNGGYTLAFDMSHDAKTLYAATHQTCDSLFGSPLVCSGGGVIKSTDGGVSWARTNLPDRTVGRVAVDPFSPQTVYAMPADETNGNLLSILRSRDGGVSWNPIGPPTPPNQLLVDPITPSNLTLLANPNLWTSRDSGDTWLLHTMELAPTTIALDPLDPQGMFVSSVGPPGPGGPSSAIFRSPDRGQTWIHFIDAPAFPWTELVVDSQRASFYLLSVDVHAYTTTNSSRRRAAKR